VLVVDVLKALAALASALKRYGLHSEFGQADHPTK
jgi:hypothetical protein